MFWIWMLAGLVSTIIFGITLDFNLQRFLFHLSFVEMINAIVYHIIYGDKKE